LIARLLTRLIAWAGLFYLVVPLVVIIGCSLTTTSYLVFPPKGLTFDWYLAMLRDRSYGSAFATSSVLAAVATAAAIVLAVPAALAMARYRFAGRNILAAFFMSPLVLPQVVLGAAIMQCAAGIGLVRSLGALLAGHVVIVMPLILRSVLPLLTPEQRTLEEASMDLGAGPFTTFRLIVLPQIRAGLAGGAVLAFISSWINVELSIFSTTAELTTIPVKLFNYVQYTVDPTIAAVSAVTIFVAVLSIVALDLLVGINVLAERR
jgi:putative spermidine/putrescine transport system permease protein